MSGRLVSPLGRITEPGFAFDIGGTLCKIVYFHPDEHAPRLNRQRSNSEIQSEIDLHEFILGSTKYRTEVQRDKEFQFHSKTAGGTFHFIKFETRGMDSAFKLIKEKGLMRSVQGGSIYGTGGGAVAFAEQFKTELGATVEKCDELEMLIQGVNFLVGELDSEVFYLRDNNFSGSGAITLDKVPYAIKAGCVHPCIIVNIGSGVSIMVVDADGKFRRVGGTSVGGGTFYGLVSAVTDCGSFRDAVDLANAGDNTRVDLLVRDIYGRDYVEHGLKGTVVASSFGKLTRPDCRDTARPEDIALSTLVMISVNIAALAHLHGNAHAAKAVMFCGSFLHDNPVAMKTLSYYTEYASKRSRRALFFDHDGYFGAIGALLKFFHHRSRAAETSAEAPAASGGRSNVATAHAASDRSQT